MSVRSSRVKRRPRRVPAGPTRPSTISMGCEVFSACITTIGTENVARYRRRIDFFQLRARDEGPVRLCTGPPFMLPKR
jgi:hypothetical protein